MEQFNDRRLRVAPHHCAAKQLTASLQYYMSCLPTSIACLQDEGNYKLAHSKLFSTLQQLKALGAPVPQELTRALALLHSYILVKSMVGLGDHMAAARLLVRVGGNISRLVPNCTAVSSLNASLAVQPCRSWSFGSTC
eukprot:GHUV01052649.1.p1 GENE.GHUV01052649.1~~GHUV01052649.1.p1  ORF type:complete len:138 (-),score=24.75 GHUV01052649.1:16-429(-)